jgi:hypothetical protein
LSTEGPQVGEISGDGQFCWDGAKWTPLARGHREPTSWTLPLRRTVAGYLAVSALMQIVTTAVFLSESMTERNIRSAYRTRLTADQIHSAAVLAYATDWVIAGVLAVVMLVLAAGSLRGWRWVFWANLVVLALTSIVGVPSALELATTLTLPAAGWISLLLALAALALLVWLIVASARFGPWAMRRHGPG